MWNDAYIKYVKQLGQLKSSGWSHKLQKARRVVVKALEEGSVRCVVPVFVFKPQNSQWDGKGQIISVKTIKPLKQPSWLLRTLSLLVNGKTILLVSTSPWFLVLSFFILFILSFISCLFFFVCPSLDVIWFELTLSTLPNSCRSQGWWRPTIVTN